MTVRDSPSVRDGLNSELISVLMLVSSFSSSQDATPIVELLWIIVASTELDSSSSRLVDQRFS